VPILFLTGIWSPVSLSCIAPNYGPWPYSYKFPVCITGETLLVTAKWACFKFKLQFKNFELWHGFKPSFFFKKSEKSLVDLFV